MKTFKSLFGMAVLALMAASCSNDMNDVQAPEQVAKDGGIHFTATIAPKNFDATTRALVENVDGSLSSNWAVGEKVGLEYEIDGTDCSVEAEVTKVADDGSAIIKATFEKAPTNGLGVGLFYPAGWSNDNITNQDGVLSAARDLRHGTSTFVVDGTDVTLASDAKLDAKYAIVSFSMGDLESNNNIDAEKVVISYFNSNLLKYETITITPETPSVYVYVTMPELSQEDVWFEAEMGDARYIAKGTANLEAGKFYKTDLKLATLGDLMNSDGSFSAVAETGKTPIGVIAYLRSPGADDPTVETTSVGGGHGLVLALKDAAVGDTNGNWSVLDDLQLGEDALVKGDVELFRTTNVSGYENTNKLVAKENAATNFPAVYKAKNYSATVPAGTTGWFLPSAQQWVKMLMGLGGMKKVEIHWNDTRSHSGNPGANFNAALAKAGEGNYVNIDDGTTSNTYYSSTECSPVNEGDAYGAVSISIFSADETTHYVGVRARAKQDKFLNKGSRSVLAF